MKLPGKIAADVPDGGRSKEQSNECHANLKRGNPLRQIYLGPITDQPISIVRENAIYLPRHGRKSEHSRGEQRDQDGAALGKDGRSNHTEAAKGAD